MVQRSLRCYTSCKVRLEKTTKTTKTELSNININNYEELSDDMDINQLVFGINAVTILTKEEIIDCNKGFFEKALLKSTQLTTTKPSESATNQKGIKTKLE